jgi:hypothetical protein
MIASCTLPEEMDAMAAGMTAGHGAARAAIKAHRPGLPQGISLAVTDDVVAGDDATVRDRKRAEVYEPWLGLARDDDFVGVQNKRGWSAQPDLRSKTATCRCSVGGLPDVVRPIQRHAPDVPHRRPTNGDPT